MAERKINTNVTDTKTTNAFRYLVSFRSILGQRKSCSFSLFFKFFPGYNNSYGYQNQTENQKHRENNIDKQTYIGTSQIEKG
jgi:hypothetical protein